MRWLLRWLFVAAVLAACSKRDATIRSDPSAADATRKRELSGRLAGEPFVARKILVRRLLDHTSISFASTTRSDPCSDETLGPGERTLSVHLWRPIGASELLFESSPTLTVLHTSARSPKRRLRLELSSYTSGRVDFDADDDSSLHGEFDAVDCPSKQHKRDVKEAIHGVAWSVHPPKVLPAAPVSGFIAGERFTPAAVALDGQRLVFYRDKPASVCPESAGDRIVLGVADVKLGPVDYTTRMVVVSDRGGPYIFEGGVAAVEFDALGKTEARGRAYAALDDVPHSMLVGAFTATVCP